MMEIESKEEPASERGRLSAGSGVRDSARSPEMSSRALAESAQAAHRFCPTQHGSPDGAGDFTSRGGPASRLTLLRRGPPDRTCNGRQLRRVRSFRFVAPELPAARGLRLRAKPVGCQRDCESVFSRFLFRSHDRLDIHRTEIRNQLADVPGLGGSDCPCGCIWATFKSIDRLENPPLCRQRNALPWIVTQ